MTTPAQLLAALNLLGVVPAQRLAAELGVSQPTVSRLVAACGDRVCRMGRGRATRYGRTRALEGLGTRLPVHRIDPAGAVHAWGTLTLLDGGATWLERADGRATLFTGLPPFAADMSPQGYLGRGFSARFPELGLPPRLSDWREDDRLLALARRGEDCVGDLIVGTESLDRWLAGPSPEIAAADYPSLARAALQDEAGSSAGGEHPKFCAAVGGRQVLVKFAHADEGPAGRRWSDLLRCEALALRMVTEAGLPAAHARIVDVGHLRCLEVERFDREGIRGRRGVLSLAAIDDEYFGQRDSWSGAAERMVAAGLIPAGDARAIRWLDAFGQLIGNSDRHFGNLALFSDGVGEGPLSLAPVYDMLPMTFAPAGTSVVERTFTPLPPTSVNLDVWPDAAAHAERYWEQVSGTSELEPELRALAARAAADVARLVSRAPAPASAARSR